MLIIGTFREDLVPGRVSVLDVADASGVTHRDVPMLVLRQVTEAEWRAWGAEQGYRMDGRDVAGARFYEVHTD